MKKTPNKYFNNVPIPPDRFGQGYAARPQILNSWLPSLPPLSSNNITRFEGSFFPTVPEVSLHIFSSLEPHIPARGPAYMAACSSGEASVSAGFFPHLKVTFPQSRLCQLWLAAPSGNSLPTEAHLLCTLRPHITLSGFVLPSPLCT